MKDKLLIGIASALALLFCTVLNCRAEIAGDDAFENAVWEQVMNENVVGTLGVVQSICATEDYIITIENISESSTEPDVVSAYYRNDVDENGNTVKPYTLANRVSDTNWEHGNGMAYNPHTKEIYVALYTHANPENRGCIFVMDPKTLAYKRTIKISDDFNILGIGYREETDQYVIQTNVDGGYSFKILDADFQVVEDLGEYAHTTKGNNFQDLEVCGDYIINFPLTLGLGIGDYINMYSISGKNMVSSPQLDFQFSNVKEDEPESLCELEPGVFLAAVNVVEDTGARNIRFYKTTVPYYFQVSAAGENGQVAGETKKVLRGEDCSLKLAPDKGYKLSEITVNGKKAEAQNNSGSFVLSNIQENQSVQVVFGKIFAAWILPFKDGSIFVKVPAALIAVIAVSAILLLAFWIYVVHVRRERRRKYLRMKRKRERERNSLQYAPVILR